MVGGHTRRALPFLFDGAHTSWPCPPARRCYASYPPRSRRFGRPARLRPRVQTPVASRSARVRRPHLRRGDGPLSPARHGDGRDTSTAKSSIPAPPARPWPEQTRRSSNDSLFKIASNSKAMTTALLARLVEAGKAALGGSRHSPLSAQILPNERPLGDAADPGAGPADS